MVVVAPRAETVERRHRIPDEIAIAQPTALFAIYRQAKLISGLLPELVESIRARVARPGAGLSENLDLDLAGVAVGGTAHVARAGKPEQAGFGVGERLGRE